MMSVLQEIKGLTKELYFPGGSPVSMQNFRSTDYMLYLIQHKHGLHYNVLSGLIITRSKRVKGKIICLCTSSDENLFKSISGSKLLWLLRYASS